MTARAPATQEQVPEEDPTLSSDGPVTAVQPRHMLPALVPATVTAVSAYVLLAALERKLGPDQRGAAAAIVALAVILSVPGSIFQVARSPSARRGNEKGRGIGRSTPLSRTLGMVVAGSLGLLALSPSLDRFLHFPNGSSGLLGPFFLVSSVGGIAVAACRNTLTARRFGAFVVARLVVGLGFGLLFVDQGLGMAGVLLAMIVGEAALIVLGLTSSAMWARRSPLQRSPVPFLPDLPPRHAALAGALIGSLWLVWHFDVVLASRFLPPPRVGSYAAAWTISRVVLGPIALLAVSLLHAFSNRGQATSEWLRRVLGATWMTALASVAILVAVRRQVVSLLFGSGFEPAARLLPMLAVAAALFSAALLLAQFHVTVRSRVFLLILPLFGLALAFASTFHANDELLIVAVAAGAASAGLLYQSAMAISRWARPLGDLSPHEEFVPVTGAVADRSQPDLSVVVPCHNSGSQLEAFLTLLQGHLDGHVPHEIIVVSDGSTDDTVRIASEFASDTFRIFHYPDRLGKGHALRVGLNQARGDYVAFIDSDGDIDPEAIVPFLSLVDLYQPDIVLGSKRHPMSVVEYPRLRRLMSWIYHMLGRVLFRINVRDTQTGLKLIRRGVLAAVLPKMLEKRFAFDLELLVVARRLGFSRIFEAPVKLHYRFASHVNPTAAFLILLDTAAIYYRRYVLDSYGPLAGLPEIAAEEHEAAATSDERDLGLAVASATEAPPHQPIDAEVDVEAGPVEEERLDDEAKGVALDESRTSAADEPQVELMPAAFLFLGIVAAIGLGLWLSRHAWGPRPPGGVDVVGVLLRADFGVNNLFAHGRIDGWFPRLSVGYQTYLLYGQGFNGLLGLLRVASFGSLSIAGALKVLVIASFVLLPAGVAFLARSLGLNRLAAGVAAILTLAVSSPFGVGLQGQFETGLLPQQVGAIFFCLALGASIRAVEHRRWRWVALGAVSFGMLIITHLWSTLAFALALAIYLFVRLLARPSLVRALPRLAIGLAAGGLLVGFWSIPFLAHHSLHGPLVDWAHPSLGSRLGSIMRGEILFRPGVSIAVVAALAATLVAAIVGWRPGFVLVALPVGFLLASHALLHYPRDYTIPLLNRDLGYVGLLAVLPLAAAIAYLGRWVPARAAVLQSLVLAGALVIVPLGQLSSTAQQFPRATPAMSRAASQLARLVPEGGRFTVEANFPDEIARTGVPHPATWLAYYSGKDAMMEFFSELSPSVAGDERYQLGTKPVADSADAFARYGVTHLVATSNHLIALLRGSPRFRMAWEEGVAIFSILPSPGQPSPSTLLSTAATPLSASRASVDPDHPRMTFFSGAPTQADIALSWSPKWHASLDGRPIAIERTADTIIRVSLPSGQHELALDLRADVWDFLGRAASVATLVGVLVLLLLRRVRRRGVASNPEGDGAEISAEPDAPDPAAQPS